MHGSGQKSRRDDPYAPTPAWRVDGMQEQLDRVEREAARRVEHVEDRLNHLLQQRLEDTLLLLFAFAVITLIVAATAGHH